jgi:hypothetical protein
MEQSDGWIGFVIGKENREISLLEKLPLQNVIVRNQKLYVTY